MRWLIGMKLGDEDHGALSFARWLDTAKDFVFVAQHTVDFSQPPTQPHIAEQLKDSAYLEARRLLGEVELDGVAVSIEPHGSAEANLASAALANDADAIILGRRAKSEGHRFVRLGAVARRMLRHLPAPVVVVGPDFSSTGIGSGPVLLAFDAETDVTRSAAFATRVAKAFDREVVVVHVHSSIAQVAAPYVPAAYLEQLWAGARDAARARLQQGLETSGLAGLRCREVEGVPIPKLIEVAREEDACLIVCSSRQLTITDRIFDSSVGSGLAAEAPCPVAVVPNHDDREPENRE